MFKDFFQKQTRNHLICLRYSYCLEDSKTISRASLENQRFRVSGQNYGKNVIEMHIFEPKSEQKVSLSSHFFLKVNTNKKQSPEVFCKKAVLKNSAILTGKQLCWRLFLIKLQAFRPATLSKKRHRHKCLLVKFAKFLKTPNLKNIGERLLPTN